MNVLEFTVVSRQLNSVNPKTSCSHIAELFMSNTANFYTYHHQISYWEIRMIYTKRFPTEVSSTAVQTPKVTNCATPSP